RVLVAAESGTWDKRHAGLSGSDEELGGVEVIRQLEPDEVPALRSGPAGTPAQAQLERLEHRVPAPAEQVTHTFDVALEQPAPQKLVQRRLRDERRRDVGRG